MTDKDEWQDFIPQKGGTWPAMYRYRLQFMSGVWGKWMTVHEPQARKIHRVYGPQVQFSKPVNSKGCGQSDTREQDSSGYDFHSTSDPYTGYGSAD